MPSLAPLGGFPQETFLRRRARALERLGRSAMVLPAAPLVRSSRDSDYPYRPDSELFYLTGVTEPEAVAVLRGHADEERFVLFVRERDPEAELWAGPRLGPEGAAERFGADAVFPVSALEEKLPELLLGSDGLFYRLDGRLPRVEALVLRVLARARARGPREGTGPRSVTDPGEVLDDMRLVKEPGELERMRRAAQVSADSVRDALARTRPGMGEWEVEALVDGGFRGRGGDGPGYETIVAAGSHACVLHYVKNRGRIGEGDLVLLDAGAAVGLYTGDITRTYPASGRFSPEQRAVYDVVEAARAASVAAVRPGASVEDVHRAALDVLVAGLVELGVLSGEPAALVEEEAYKPFYPHRTSHWLGLDVHDPGDYARSGRSRALEPGMVLTIEPGLYFAPQGPAGEGPFSGIGVRVEDDVAVTADGGENLTAALPTAAEAVAALVGTEA